MSIFFIALLAFTAYITLKEIKDVKKRRLLILLYAVMLLIAFSYAAGEVFGELFFNLQN